MAGVGIRAVTPEVALSAGVAKTCIQLLAATNVRVLVRAVRVSFKGTVATEAPVDVQLVRQTGAGTGTALGAATLGKLNPVDTETLNVTGTHTSTVEPTSDDFIVDRFKIHPQENAELRLPLTAPIPIPGGYRLGVKMNAPSAETVVVTVEGEE